MSTVRESKRAHHGRASKKAPTPRRRVVAELTKIAETIEALNGQLEALTRRGAR
jgi:hypothetical protein